MSDLFAVLTGDIVRSSKLDSAKLDRAMAALARGAEQAAGWADAPARFARFRGDGWQCLAPSPARALRTALLLKAHLRREGREFDTRVSVGIGTAELPDSGDLAAAAGSAFRLAGHGLDTMRRTVRLAIAWAEPPPDAPQREAIVALLDEISRRWTPAQAGILVSAIAPNAVSQVQLAGRLGVSQQMVAKHLRAASFGSVEIALAAIEGTE